MKKNHIFLISVSLITIGCWLFTEPIKPASLLAQISQLIGALSMVGFACVIFISTRHPLLEDLFEGLDKAYVSHKWVGIVSLVLIFVHIGLYQCLTYEKDIWGVIGYLSLMLLLILMLIAILAKKMNYEIWRYIHKLICIPYFIALVHYYKAADYAVFALTPFSIWLNLVNLIGVISLIYSIFLYEKIAYPHHYKVSSINDVAKDTIEITGTALREDVSFIPGQFVFLKFTSKSLGFPSHPFTISDAIEKGTIKFTIKNLGDHTANLLSTVKISDEFHITRPHGRFNFLRGGNQQIWIAGGIGITPFRSFYKSGIPQSFSIDFFYAYNNEEEAPYLNEVKAINQDNIRIHLIDFTATGFLTVEMLKEHIGVKQSVDVYFCGPKPMRKSLIKNLKNSGWNVLNFHFEQFEFK